MNGEYDSLTHRIFCETLERNTHNDDNTSERCYIASTEHLSEYMKDMNLKNKRIATVGSSGDQFFQALLQGCQDITIIDANPYSKMFVEYKKALFQNLDFTTMKKVIKNTGLFNWKVYAKISHSLPKSAKQFWDTIMLEQDNYHCALEEQFDQNMIARQLVHHEAVFFCDFYNDETIYLKLQALLRKKEFKLKFITADLHEFPKALNGTYDVIMLSNIFDYQSFGEQLVKFEKTVQSLYNKKLNPGGTIQVRYSYNKHWGPLGINTIAGHDLRIQELAADHDIRTIYFIDKPESSISISF